ncbi:hypothetical protein CJJ07_004594 [Candidozyma auris]|nr:hypothetical protein CJJ07_004594 [[Candida] auris]QEL62070.1 hypothetical protein CJJ09_004235 [[Candida] auris]
MASVQKVKRCPGCHHTKFIQDMSASSGDLLCENCGMVQEENPIISEVQFGESSSGAAMVQGAMVGADQARANFSMRNAMESREQTLLSAKSKIRKLGSAMRIPEYIMESASGWFKLALVQNFVQGRRSQNVIAACLYVACRHERTHHLLIDFSSRLQISVYSLGATYLKLVRALQIQKLPLADPSLFIQHFAERLGFGDQTAKVCRDATKIAQRMASDWIFEGRRPAGVAGACLLLAARMNNFRRSHVEIVAVARVGGETIQKRLNEFRKTKSGVLTLNEFRESEKTEPSLPPSYQQNRNIESKIQKMLRQRARMLKSYKRLASRNKLFDALFEEEMDERPQPKKEPNSSVASTQQTDVENGENERPISRDESSMNEQSASRRVEDNEVPAPRQVGSDEEAASGQVGTNDESVAKDTANKDASNSEATGDVSEREKSTDNAETNNDESVAENSAQNNSLNKEDANDQGGPNALNSNEEPTVNDESIFDDMYDIMPADIEDEVPQVHDPAYKPSSGSGRLRGLSSDRKLRVRKERNYAADNFNHEAAYDAMEPFQAIRKRRATNVSMAKKDSLLKSVLAGGEISEKELESALDHIWSSQQKTLKEALYSIPSEERRRARVSELFVPETGGEGDEDGNESALPTDPNEKELLRRIELNRPRNLVKNCPTTESLLSKVPDNPELNDDDDDSEVEFLQLTPAQAKKKEEAWVGMNYDFLIAQEKKNLKQAADEIAGNTSGQPRKRRRIKESSVDPVINDPAVANAISQIGEDGRAVTPAESAKQLLQSKNFSKKINYSSIGDLFNK